MESKEPFFFFVARQPKTHLLLIPEPIPSMGLVYLPT